MGYTSLGFCIAGAFFDLAGGLMVCTQQFMDIGMGVGIVIHAISSLMLGEVILGNETLKKQRMAPILGAFIYQKIRGLVLSFGLAPLDLILLGQKLRL